jgi:hypothetical protein
MSPASKTFLDTGRHTVETMARQHQALQSVEGKIASFYKITASE